MLIRNSNILSLLDPYYYRYTSSSDDGLIYLLIIPLLCPFRICSLMLLCTSICSCPQSFSNIPKYIILVYASLCSYMLLCAFLCLSLWSFDDIPSMLYQYLIGSSLFYAFVPEARFFVKYLKGASVYQTQTLHAS